MADNKGRFPVVDQSIGTGRRISLPADR
jgi:hypothetical protein